MGHRGSPRDSLLRSFSALLQRPPTSGNFSRQNDQQSLFVLFQQYVFFPFGLCLEVFVKFYKCLFLIPEKCTFLVHNWASVLLSVFLPVFILTLLLSQWYINFPILISAPLLCALLLCNSEPQIFQDRLR